MIPRDGQAASFRAQLGGVSSAPDEPERNRPRLPRGGGCRGRDPGRLAPLAGAGERRAVRYCTTKVAKGEMASRATVVVVRTSTATWWVPTRAVSGWVQVSVRLQSWTMVHTPPVLNQNR